MSGLDGLQASTATPPRDIYQPDTCKGQSTRKRRRTVNSCIGCRRRKSRCDRAQPCEECVKNADWCQYTDEASKTQASSRCVVAAQQRQDIDVAPNVTSLPAYTAAIPISACARCTPKELEFEARIARLEALTKGQIEQSPFIVEDSQLQQIERNPSHPSPEISITLKQNFLRGKNGKKTELISSFHWISLIRLVGLSTLLFEEMLKP